MIRHVLFVLPLLLHAQDVPLKVDSLDGQTLKISAERYQGRDAMRVVANPSGTDSIAFIKGSNFHNGVIELELSGAPGTGAGEGARGFVGIAFRVAPDKSKYECFYLRPTNGRADDQLRRNHSTQYVSYPDWPWERLRKETPGLYESYVDLQPGAWTKVKIAVEGTKARLYVHGADQPALIVNDLKMGDKEGALALWVGPGTDAHFANLRVSR